jgi:hypothetical protein
MQTVSLQDSTRAAVQQKPVDTHRWIFFSLIQLFLSPLLVNAVVCNHTIDLSVKIADGGKYENSLNDDPGANYAAVQPGDTVCVAAGTRIRLVLRNFRGTASAPITFVNSDGQVLFQRNTTFNFALLIQNSRYFRVTGTGVDGIPYGFKVDGGLAKCEKTSPPSCKYSIGVSAQEKSSDFELDHIEVTHTNKGGIHFGTSATCPDGSTNNYDYDHDGQIAGDPDDVVTASDFTHWNILIHNNNSHDTGTEGYYLGTNPTSVSCSTSSVPNPVTKGLWVYDNIAQRNGWNAINPKSIPQDCYVYKNRVYEDSTKLNAAQSGGITMNRLAKCEVYNNLIKDGYSAGIVVNALGSEIYNNVIVNPGRGFSRSHSNGSAILARSADGASDSYFIWNNTIVNPKSYGIYFSAFSSLGSRIQNNIIARPNSTSATPYIFKCRRCSISADHNYQTLNTAELKFNNPSADDYSLLPDSPAIDAGADLSPEVPTDYQGTTRPQPKRGTYDIGAYEFIRSHPPEP